MNGRLIRRVVNGVCAATLAVAAGQPVTAQTQLPEGKGKAETMRVCGMCHPAERGASVRLTREGWQDVMARMVTLGAKGPDEELELVLDYLTTHFKGEALKPLNLNKATAIELESIAGFLRKEATVWMDHRTKQGPCTALEDLKKVRGVDFKKVDARRDRLVCF